MQRSQGVSVIEASSFQGPIPSPQLLRAYDEVAPGLAAQIIGWTEREGAHRREMERTVVRWTNALDLTGMLVAFLLAAGTLSGSFYLLLHDKPIGGLAGLIATIASLTAVFYVSRRQTIRPTSGQH